MAKGNGEMKVVEAIAKLGERIDALGEKIEGLRSDMNVGFDRVLEVSGEHWRDHEKRITALERKVGR